MRAVGAQSREAVAIPVPSPASPPRSTKKRPITDGAQMAALLDAAKRLSLEHWEVVLILYRTGIEVKALSKVTWRDFVQGKLIWRRPKKREELHIPVDDDELLRAVRGFIARPKRSSDHLDRLVSQAVRETRLRELSGASPMTLRLTRCYLMLSEGRPAEGVARQLALAPALVRELEASLFAPSPPEGDRAGKVGGAPTGDHA